MTSTAIVFYPTPELCEATAQLRAIGAQIDHVSAGEMVHLDESRSELLETLGQAMADAIGNSLGFALYQQGQHPTPELDAVQRLMGARLAYATAALNHAEAERILKLEECKAEARAIEKAGGDEKAVGADEAARKRNLALAVAADEDYRKAQDLVRRTYLDLHARDAEMKSFEDRLALVQGLFGR